MGLKSAPYIASRSMQLVLNQRNFELWIQALEDEELKKELMKHKLASLVYVYIDDLLVSSPKILGTRFHLCVLDFVIDMLSTSGFKINKKNAIFCVLLLHF